MKAFISRLCPFMLCAVSLLMACQPSQKQQEFSLPYEKYVLANGLEVVLHQDRSDPIVAVAIQYHVGSNREKPGRTGFAHFFEHMLFQRSENLARNEYIAKINDLGGTFNGGTSSDGTIYFEVVPNDALEKVLWMESDRMGFFINTVTQQGLEREIDVVVNEKRQMVDNRPYGHTDGVIKKALYPFGHPYSWTVIGEIADLQASTVDHVKEFYHHFYAPNNATLVIAGNFETAKAKEWVEKYFGEIKSRNEIEKPVIQVPTLEKDVKLYHLDKFANMPELTIVYPSPEMYSKDAYALHVLIQLLSQGKKAPLYKEIVENSKLAPSVRMYNSSMELAGEIRLAVRAFPEKPLDDVYAAIQKGMEEFEKNGVNPEDLQRIKNMTETSFYRGISSVLDKAYQIAYANVFGGSPDKMIEEIEQLNAVTPEDVMRVYQQYIKGKPAVITSFVPVGKQELVLTGSVEAEVTEDNIESQEMKSAAGAIQDEDYERTPSDFDRSIEPPLDILSELSLPEIWNSSLPNGIKIYGIEQTESPIVFFNLAIPAGYGFDPEGKAGVAALTAQLLREGTLNKTPEELEDAIKGLGASLSINASLTATNIYGNCLARNTQALSELVLEMLTQPRWDEKEFERLKQQNIARLEEQKVQPNAIAQKLFSKLVLTEEPWAASSLGTIESLRNITIEDVKQFFADNYVSSTSNLMITGAINKEQTEKTFASLSDNWRTNTNKPTKEINLSTPAKGGNIYFVDYPEAKQSVILIGKRAMNISDPTYYPAVIANHKLGDGSGSDLFRVLRLERGYTYGAYSYFNSARDYGVFMASSSVQTTVTKEALEIFKDMISNYGKEYTEENLETSRNAMLRQKSGNYETVNSLLSILNEIVLEDRPADFPKQEETILKNITLDEVKDVINKEMNFEDMVIIVVGDAKTQYANLEKLGLGKPILTKVD